MKTPNLDRLEKYCKERKEPPVTLWEKTVAQYTIKLIKAIKKDLTKKNI